jgi:hypothetical protein
MKKLKIIWLSFSLIFLEFFRDYTFVNINAQLYYLNKINQGYDIFNYTDSSILYFIDFFSYSGLYKIKWLLTLVFFLFYIANGLLLINFFFKNPNLTLMKIYIISGILILFSGFLMYVISTFMNIENQYNFYSISLELSHFVQSSLYPISFLLIFYAHRKMKIDPKY